jgi:DNA mismatch endonuclease, patch repair protein
MGRVKSRDTRPELVVRRLMHGMGYRYRLHAADLPGRPDLVFRPRRKVVFVHGCFWHGHKGCALARIPKSRSDFWQAKFTANQARDARATRDLRGLGYRALTIWECELDNLAKVEKKLRRFIDEEH